MEHMSTATVPATSAVPRVRAEQAPAQPGPGRTRAPRRARRTELAAFLRSRRGRIRPEDVGLPPGFRRRTAGLRREEVAQLSGVGVTWYTWLEQGRPINASPQVLDAVARTLRLDPVERQHLYRLAEVPVEPAPDRAEHRLRQEFRDILDALVPLPASVVTDMFDLLAWNSAYAALFPNCTSAPPGQRNTLLSCFTHPDCCHPILNREEQISSMVAQLRGAYGQHVGEPAWTSFIERLESASPRFARMWAAQEVGLPATHLKVFRHPRFERLVMKSASMTLPRPSGTRMVVYTPVDQETRDVLPRLAAGEGAGLHFPCWPHHQAGT
jgi:transcriptional regulator with XRE-family HTH domain